MSEEKAIENILEKLGANDVATLRLYFLLIKADERASLLGEIEKKIGLIFSETLEGDGFVGCSDREWEKIKMFLPLLHQNISSFLSSLKKKHE